MMFVLTSLTNTLCFLWMLHNKGFPMFCFVLFVVFIFLNSFTVKKIKKNEKPWPLMQ